MSGTVSGAMSATVHGVNVRLIDNKKLNATDAIKALDKPCYWECSRCDKIISSSHGSQTSVCTNIYNHLRYVHKDKKITLNNIISNEVFTYQS